MPAQTPKAKLTAARKTLKKLEDRLEMLKQMIRLLERDGDEIEPETLAEERALRLKCKQKQMHVNTLEKQLGIVSPRPTSSRSPRPARKGAPSRGPAKKSASRGGPAKKGQRGPAKKSASRGGPAKKAPARGATKKKTGR